MLLAFKHLNQILICPNEAFIKGKIIDSAYSEISISENGPVLWSGMISLDELHLCS